MKKFLTPNEFENWINSLYTISNDEAKELISKYRKAYRTLIAANITIVTLIIIGVILIIVLWK